MKNRYRICLVLILFAFFLPASLSGQGSEKKGWGYGFFGGGYATDGSESEGIVHMGGGVDLLLAGGLGVGLEIGSLSWGGISDGVGVFSPGVIYAFNTDKKTMPFITGGYTLFFRDGSANGAFFGGGVNYLIGDNWGIRVEGRDQVFVEDWSFHNLEARFGVMFSWD